MEFSAGMIASLIGGTIIGDPEAKVNNFAKIEEGDAGCISFLANDKYEHYIYETKSSVVLVNNNLGYQGNDVLVKLVACEYVLELLFNNVTDESLRVCTAYCKWHFGKSVNLFAGIVLQEDIANLWAVAVTYNYIVIALYEVEKALASLVNVRFLFFYCAFLSCTEQRISAKGLNCQFLVRHNCFYSFKI